MMDLRYKIGRITLKTEKTFQQLFECAAWYRNVKCAPQTVDLIYLAASGGYVLSRFEGEVESSDFQSLWGGVPIPGTLGSNRNRDVGERASYTVQTSAYLLVDLIHDPDYEVWIDPSVTVTAEVKTLSPEDPYWSHTSVFARIALPADAKPLPEQRR